MIYLFIIGQQGRLGGNIEEVDQFKRKVGEKFEIKIHACGKLYMI